MMKGSQNLSVRKEEMEEVEEDSEVSSRVNDDMDLKADRMSKQANSMFFNCNYWELREKKLKELGMKGNFLENGEASSHEIAHALENGKIVSEEVNVKENRSFGVNGKDISFKNELNDLLSKKVHNFFYFISI